MKEREMMKAGGRNISHHRKQIGQEARASTLDKEGQRIRKIETGARPVCVKS